MSKRIDAVIHGGRVVAGGTVTEATVAISEGAIVALLAPGTLPPEASEAEQIDASGKIVMPGVIDAHVHFAAFSQAADSFQSMSVAAAHGGVTTVIPYVKGKEAMRPGEFLAHFRQEGESQSLVDFALHCQLDAPEPEGTGQMEEAFDLGVTSFKMSMGGRQGPIWDDYHLLEALEYLGSRGGVFLAHGENADIVRYLQNRSQSRGRFTAEEYPATRPPEAEAEATYRALILARLTGCPLYLPHVSVRTALALAEQARLEGQQLWIEVSPHHLTLTEEEMKLQGGLTKMAPPLRTSQDLEALWGAVADGSADVIASDHAPYTLDRKLLPPERFREIPNGIPGVETMLPLMYTEGVATDRIGLPRLVQLLCERPARAFGLWPRKGAIAVGADADLVLIDPNAQWVLDARGLHSGAGYTPYDGRKLRGKPVATLIRGEIVVRDGELLRSPGHGRYLARQGSGLAG